MENVLASVITIGDEILIGQIVDTNSAFISTELNKIGIWVHRKLSVGDTRQAIWQALEQEGQQSDIILITGGLGPTADDITKPLLCDYFGGKMVVNEKVKDHVIYLFEKVFRRPIIESNLKQAEVPDVCEVLVNERGTAPGMLFRKDKKIFISMPGVPYEMKGIITEHVIPLLQKEFITQHITHRTLLTAGIGESFLSERLKSFETNLPAFVKLAYLPNYGMVRLRLTAKGGDSAATEIQLNTLFDQLKDEVKDYLVTDKDVSLETALAELLNKKKSTLCTAESCTGGYIAHLLTANPNSSSFLTGSVVCYDKKVKSNVLAVDKDVLEKEGTVNETVARQMVQGVLQLLGSDYALAVTGLMGPDAGGEKEPVGTVWIGVGNKNKIITKQFFFRFDRRRNIELTAVNALNLLRLFILENY